MKRSINFLITNNSYKQRRKIKLSKKSFVILLAGIELLLIAFASVSYGNKNLDKYVFGNLSATDSGLFAVMIEDSDGNYKQSTDNTFPGYEYFYNQTKSGCMTSKGKQIPDTLLYDQDSKKATVKASETSLCYLYFDKYKTTSFADQLIDSGDLWQSGLDGDGYRYVGSGEVGADTNPDNFICFGTTSKSDCTTNQDKYMYRIIGVFADASGNNHVKLIKNTQIGLYAWNADNLTDVPWGNSDMYKGLNGSYFLTNTTYEYMQDTTWGNRIENWTWSAVNTKSYEDQTNNPDYYYSSPTGIYLNETHKTSSETLCKSYNETAINCNGGEWTNPVAKIGLMYASDYALSLGSSALALTTGTYANKELLSTGWMFQSSFEWTISRRGAYTGGFDVSYDAWGIRADGYVLHYGYGHKSLGARPVFYLTSIEAVSEGDGSLENPFIIDTSSSAKLSVSTSASGSTLTAKITKGTGNLNKYCINNKASINDCKWINITSTTITYDMSEETTYYVHVIDDAGYIAHSSYTYKLPVLTEYLIASGDLYQSGLEDDGYRYAGSGAVGTDTNPDNFICFGTSKKSDCIANLSKYMYRVIGVFADSAGNNHVKLIKYRQFESLYAWNTDDTKDVNWGDSTLYAALNGSAFLTNTTYDYLQDTTWNNKIENWTWSAANTISEGSQTASAKRISYSSDITPSQVYLHEMNKSGKGIMIGEWTTPTGKIGLMYSSDYYLAASADMASTTSYVYEFIDTTKAGWIHPSNIDVTRSPYEYVLSRVGYIGYSESYDVNIIREEGNLNLVTSSYTGGIRPVFYLTSNVKMSGGTGTLEDPIMIN